MTEALSEQAMTQVQAFRSQPHVAVAGLCSCYSSISIRNPIRPDFFLRPLSGKLSVEIQSYGEEMWKSIRCRQSPVVLKCSEKCNRTTSDSSFRKPWWSTWSAMRNHWSTSANRVSF